VEDAVLGIRIPETDIGPLNRQIDQIDAHLRARMAGLEELVARLRNADLAPLEKRLGGMEDLLLGLNMPEVDLGPVHSGIATLGLSIRDMKPGLNLEPVNDQLAGLRTLVAGVGERLDSSRRADVEALNARVTALAADMQRAVASINIPAPDFNPIQVRLEDITRAVAALDRRPVDADLQARFTTLQSSFGAAQTESRRALEPIERGVAGLQEAMQGIGPDLSPVLDAVVAIDSRKDLAAVENRLTAIEYSLAALHHMMRSRTETTQVRAGSSWQVRPGTVQATNGEPRGAPALFTKPPREHDPINPVRRPGEMANLLVEAAFGPADDLSQINGVGPILSQLLNDTGVFYFWQIAEWTPEDARTVDNQLTYFRGRIKRDDWVGHARSLAALPASARRPMGH